MKRSALNLKLLPFGILMMWMGLGLLFAFQDYAAMRTMKEAASLRTLILLWSVHFSFWAFLSAICWKILRPLLEGDAWVRLLLAFAPVSLVVSFVETTLYVVTYPHIVQPKMHWTFMSRLLYNLAANMVTNLVISWALLFLYRGVWYYRQFREREVCAARLETELVAAQLRTLRMQLNPHFLFNTLNGVSSLMRHDVDAADKMLELLSRLLRMTLESGDVQRVRLSKELESVVAYLSIQAQRFGPRVRYRIVTEEGTEDALVPVMILQPIVENAYVHGIARSNEDGLIEIESSRKGENLVLSVTNTGPGLLAERKSARTRPSLGIANLNARLLLHYQDKQSFTLEQLPDGRVLANVVLPFEAVASSNEDSKQLWVL